MKNVRSKPFHCAHPNCEKHYSRISSLNRHIKTFHEKQKQFSCKFCMKQFGFKNNMIRHEMILHSTKCEYCEKGFVKKYDLQDHIKESHEGKLFVCDVCDTVFEKKKLLIAHYWSLHEKHFNCKLCMKQFGYKENMIRHEMILHSRKCEYCGKNL